VSFGPNKEEVAADALSARIETHSARAYHLFQVARACHRGLPRLGLAALARCLALFPPAGSLSTSRQGSGINAACRRVSSSLSPHVPTASTAPPAPRANNREGRDLELVRIGTARTRRTPVSRFVVDAGERDAGYLVDRRTRPDSCRIRFLRDHNIRFQISLVKGCSTGRPGLGAFRVALRAVLLSASRTKGAAAHPSLRRTRGDGRCLRLRQGKSSSPSPAVPTTTTELLLPVIEPTTTPRAPSLPPPSPRLRWLRVRHSRRRRRQLFLLLLFLFALPRSERIVGAVNGVALEGCCSQGFLRVCVCLLSADC
jgi:hypothetical protein